MAKTAEVRSKSREDTGTFLPIKLASLRVDTVTDFDIYFQASPGQPFVLYSERHGRFTEKAQQRLLDSKLNTVYILPSQQAAYGRYVEANLATILADDDVPSDEKAEALYASSGSLVEDILDQPESKENVQRSKDIVKNTVNFMLTERNAFASLLKKVSLDYRVYTHSVNVVTYAVSLAQRSGHASAATLRELAIGALLHDMGKCRISQEILASSGALSEREWEEMKQHPRYGHEILSSTGAVGEIALDIVLHHHEKRRGGGYPDNIDGDSISPFVRIVSIADVFDALTTNRPYQQAQKTFTALSIMGTRLAADLDPDLFHLFVEMMGHPAR
jgi:HD-GYP domain-containing protein (c-di-GMP phosphodiesterase class II)